MKRYLYFLAAGHMSVDMISGALPAILPFLVSERGMTYTQVAGLVFAAAFLCSLLQPVFGWLADRVNNHWFMGAGIVLAAVTFSSIAVLDDYWSIFVAVSIMGVGSSMFHPEAARLVNLISARHKGEGMAIFSVGGNAGFAVGPILAVAMLTVFGLKGLLVFALVGVGMGIATLVTVPKIIRLSGSARSSTGQLSSSRGASNDWSAFRRLTVILIGRSTIFNGMMAFLPLYCIEKLSVSIETGSSLVSIYAVIGILMTMLGGRLADRFESVSVLKVCTSLYVPTIFLITRTVDFTLILILLVPLAFATHGAYSPFVVLGQTYLARNIGFASGVTLGLSTSLGGVIMPILGLFADAFGVKMALTLLSVVGLICTIAASKLPKPRT